MSDGNWVQLFAAEDQQLIDILIGKLAEANIEAVKINKTDSSYGGLGFGGGLVEIHVPQDQVLIARQLIAKHSA